MLKYQEVKNLVDDEKNLPLLNRIAARFGISDFKGYVNQLGGFTLAEMLVIMLIGSIFLAASMPVISKRTKTIVDPEDDIWRYTMNKQDIYFEDKVNVGSNTDHNNASLFVTSAGTDANPQIGLSNPYSNAFLRFGAGNKFVLGSGTATVGDNADNGIAIGHGAQTYIANSIAIGTNAVVNDVALQENKKKGQDVTWFVSSFNYFYTLTCLHNFISATTTHTNYGTCHYYSQVAGYYQAPVCSYVYGVGYSCSVGSCTYQYGVGTTCTGVYHPAYYNIHYYTCVTGYYISFTYSYRFWGQRAAGAYSKHYVKVRCPETITVISSSTGISYTIYAQPSIVGDFAAFTDVSASGYHSGWTRETSKALYTFELSQGAINPYVEHTSGFCHSEIYSSTSATGLKIAAAKTKIQTEANARFASTPAIAIGAASLASSKNTIAIGYGATANDDNWIVLGNSSSSLSVNGVTYTSDLGLKNVKGLYQRGIKELRKLKTYLFSFKSDKDNVVRAGLIAQDVQKVMPEAVTKSKKGHLAIKNEFITFAMFNAILDLDDAISNVSKRQFVLERKVYKQEKQMDRLEKMAKQLKNKK